MFPHYPTKCAGTFSRPGTWLLFIDASSLRSPQPASSYKSVQGLPFTPPRTADRPAESLLAASARAPWLTQGDLRLGLAALRLC
jgi:hypothetical protein